MRQTEIDPTDLVAQQEQAELQAELQQLRQEQADNDLTWLMGQEAGRRFIWELLGSTGVNRNPFAVDAASTAFRCGELNVGQRLTARIHAICPDTYFVMVKEQQEYERSRRNARS